MNGPNMILRAGAIITVNDRFEVLQPGWLRIVDGRIETVSDRPIPPQPGDEELDAGHLVLLPGLVNAHTHLFQTLLRGVYEEIPFPDWLAHIYACGAVLSADDGRVAAELGGVESLRSGVTTVVEHQFLNRGMELADASIDGLRRVGVRTVLARTIIDLGGLAPADALETPRGGLASVEELLDAHASELDDGMLTLLTGPNTPGASASGELALATRAFAERHGIGQSMHLNESAAVIESVRREHAALGPVDWLERIGALGDRILAAHCVHLEPSEIEILARRGVVVSHNPVSNGVLGDGIAPVVELLAAGVVVALGTDGAASNNAQDMFEVMKSAILLQRGRLQDASVLPPSQVLRMATINGARGIGLEHLVGSLEPGKRADIIGLNLLGRAHSVALHDVVSQVVYTGRPSNVELAMVDGRILLRDGEVLSVDEQGLLAKAQTTGTDLVRRLAEPASA
jgi:5-methylthioadenosine/S-adenosylhomocysteine deaminase